MTLPRDTHPGDPRYPMGSRYDRRRCDYCKRWIGVNVRRQHYRACVARKRETEPNGAAKDEG